MGSRLARWFGVEHGDGTFLLDPDDAKTPAGERLIVVLACCEALLLLGAASFGLWLFWRSA